MHSIFGTDGIRGRFNKEITYSLAYRIGFALGLISKENNSEPIVIGRDTRISGHVLLEALSIGIVDSGKEFINIGICPTPAIPFLIRQESFCSGIMISASHNPPDYNGIKIFDENGNKISPKIENQIETIVEDLKKIKVSSKSEKSIKVYKTLLDKYIESLIDSFDNENLEGMKIVLDTCFGSATTCAEKIFDILGADVKVINNDKNGQKINLNCGSTCLDPLNKAVYQYDADMGFSFDGDADRVIGIDSKGNILDGDHILFLWGRELMKKKVLPNNTVISTKMANLGFENAWNKIGGILYRTEVGDKFIHEELIKRDAVLGGEQSGHILSKLNNFCGDGILTAIQIAKFCKQKKISLNSWLESSFLPYPQKLTNINLDFDFKKTYNSFTDIINETTEIYANNKSYDCRIYVRPSGTEPLLRVLVEARDPEQVDFLSKKISGELQSKIKKISNTI